MNTQGFAEYIWLDGGLAVFHGPRLLARYNAEGQLIDRSSLGAAA